MIKARLVTEAGPMAVLGLTGENVTRLVAGEPMIVDLADLGMSGRVVVMYGRTERDVVSQLEEVGMVPPGTATKTPEPQPGQSVAFFKQSDSGT